MFKFLDAQNAACNAVTRLVDLGSTYSSGSLNIYDFTNSILTQLNLSFPAFADATDGTAVSNFIMDSTALMDGTAISFGVLNRDASTVWTGTVSTYAGTGDLKLNSIYILADSTVAITDIVYIVPPEFSYFGAQGSTGIQGQTGIQGITGAQGQTGIQGITGISSNALIFNASTVGSVPTGIMGNTILSSNARFDYWTLITDMTSSLKIDIQKSSYADYPNTVSMHGSTGVFINSSVKNMGTTGAWGDNSASSGDIIKVILTESDGTASKISLLLY